MASFDIAIIGIFNREVTYDTDGTVKVNYTNHQTDRGGETKWGISKKAYPHLDIRNLSKGEAREIYKEDYWNRLCLDMVYSQKLAEAVLDFGVTSGTKRSAKEIQKCVGVHVDGYIGPVTLNAINREDAEKVLLMFALRRVRYYSEVVKSHPGQVANIRGWVNRTLAVAGIA